MLNTHVTKRSSADCMHLISSDLPHADVEKTQSFAEEEGRKTTLFFFHSQLVHTQTLRLIVFPFPFRPC